MNKPKNQSNPKVKGPIRWEALVPATVLVVITAAYFHFFFDGHLRRSIEWIGYNAIGSEVNLATLKTSFSNASLQIQNIEITDAEKPTHNSITIGEIRFSMSWDALLRAKIVINEAVVEQLEFGNQRQHPGKVKPPEPISTEPGMAEKIKALALKEAQEQTGENILGDIIALLSGADSSQQADKLQSTLASKEMLQKFEADLKVKQQTWDQKIKGLPQGKDISSLSDRLGKIKLKDFKSPQELQNSLQDLDRVFKDGDSMYKQIQGTSDELTKDLKALELQYKDIEKQVQTDIATLEQHFRIPKMDTNAITKAMFNRYLGPYKAKFYRYKSMADKYVPPNLLKKDKAQEDIVIQPHPRENGISYEFGRPNGYPLFWVKRTAISSQAGRSPHAGNIKGEIINITSNQRLVGKPTELNIAGDFPSAGIFGFVTAASFDNTKGESKVDYKLSVGSYPISGKNLVDSSDAKIGFNKATGSLSLRGNITALKNVTIALENKISQIEYQVSAKNEIADQILKNVFAGVPTITLSVEGKGAIPDVPLSINSNLGTELQKGFEKQIQAKVDDARKKMQLMIDQEIGKQKAQIDSELGRMRGQLGQEVKKLQDQLNEQKHQAEVKADQAKKDVENQGKKQLEKEGQKALDDLKKKFGL